MVLILRYYTAGSIISKSSSSSSSSNLSRVCALLHSAQCTLNNKEQQHLVPSLMSTARRRRRGRRREERTSLKVKRKNKQSNEEREREKEEHKHWPIGIVIKLSCNGVRPRRPSHLDIARSSFRALDPLVLNTLNLTAYINTQSTTNSIDPS